MSDESRIEQLLEEILDADGTPEEFCADYPHLLNAVRHRLRQCQSVEAQIEAMFPPSNAPSVAARKRELVEGSPLPQIPGYEVVAVLGRGGVGVVYKARHLKLNRYVALKMLLSGVYAGPHELARFKREAQDVASLQNAHIVQVHDVGDLEGRPFFTMEFVEGGSLAHQLRGVPQPALRAAALLATLASAVHVAHQGGIIHRDLKPSNILLAGDGTPKITDFGLARRFEGEADVTQSGVRVGTPSYMAPEQATGKAPVGPAADIYGLGAILYEMLTGRPPFKAETASETERQLISREPVTPSRLNAKVPRDLDTICLKCLRKDPAHRYASAAALADDLTRFQAGLPIQARPLSWGGRIWRWSRRHPSAAALSVTATTLFALVLGGGLWMERQQAERRAETARQEGRSLQATEAALEQAKILQVQGRWPEARAALEGVPRLLDASAPTELRKRLQQAREDAEMVTELEEIRLRLSEGRKTYEKVSPERMYSTAFQKYGISLTIKPAEAAARIRNSAIRETLIAFLHDWLHWVSDKDRDKLRDMVNVADDDKWRRAFRNELSVKTPGGLKALAAAPQASLQSPVVLSGLGGTLIALNLREEALVLLREAQLRHPDDFWINYLLGLYWGKEQPQQAVGYFRAAVAIRPSSDQGYAMLGRALRDAGDADAAIAAFRKAIGLNSNCAVGKDLAKALTPSGGLEDARAVWKAALDRDPPENDAWYGYSQLCLFLGKEDEYHRASKALMDRFENSASEWWVFAERTSLACLLRPAPGIELQRAAELADRAVAAGEKSTEPGNAYLKFLKGLAEYRRGQIEAAIPFLKMAAEKLNRPGPKLVLAMAQFQSGSKNEARKTLALAVRAYNWKESQADHPTAWISHILRREAETMILSNLPAFLQGDYQPKENDERLALLGICQFQNRNVTAARLYAEAFATERGLADELTKKCFDRAAREKLQVDQTSELNTESRFLAARCAALAGCGLGEDAAKLSVTERLHWREQARTWLQEGLATCVTRLTDGSQPGHDLAKQMLQLWRSERDFSGLRDSDALTKLPKEERDECIRLWTQIDGALNHATYAK